MLGFIISLGAGFAAPYLHESMARPIARAMRPLVEVEEDEIGVLSYMIMVLLAGLAAALLHSGTPFWIALGCALGYFGSRLVAGLKAALDSRRDG